MRDLRCPGSMDGKCLLLFGMRVFSLTALWVVIFILILFDYLFLIGEVARDPPPNSYMEFSVTAFSYIQFGSVAQSCLTVCDPMNGRTPGLPVHHQLTEFTQTHVHWVGDTIQPSHPLSSPSPPALNLSQHQGLFSWVSSSHQVAKVLEFQLQHQSLQWTPRTDLL